MPWTTCWRPFIFSRRFFLSRLSLLGFLSLPVVHGVPSGVLQVGPGHLQARVLVLADGCSAPLGTGHWVRQPHTNRGKGNPVCQSTTPTAHQIQQSPSEPAPAAYRNYGNSRYLPATNGLTSFVPATDNLANVGVLRDLVLVVLLFRLHKTSFTSRSAVLLLRHSSSPPPPPKYR